MQNTERTWRKNNDWKARYSKLYSSRRISLPKEENSARISFMTDETNPYQSLLAKMRDQKGSASPRAHTARPQSPIRLKSLMTQRNAEYPSTCGMGSLITKISSTNNTLSANDTLLLDMVRARYSHVQESQNQTLDLPCDDVLDDDISNGTCVHGLSVRMTERSISRSRTSRFSTRRDMDIPSILAFTTTTASKTFPHAIPAFQNIGPRKEEEIPRWSIRRSVCPVCSQKWKDRSSILNVKNSGLKRNLSSELPSVIAPARLRTSIMMGYVPRPALAAVDKDAGLIHGGLKNTSAIWQLTRARRFRSSKPLMPPPEATAPPSVTASLARNDLDIRVHRFLKDEK